jgi:hypothetical protein
MPAGLGGGGAVAIVPEVTLGTGLDPTTAGAIWVPIISESLNYVEDKYYSEAIRQQTIDNDVKSSYYHVEGDIVAEVDMNWLPLMLYASRHSITKTGASAPFTYDFVPSSAGAASTAASGAVPRTMSITVQRNGIGFLYAGCVVNTWEFTIENGVLRVTMGILGTGETTPAGLGTATWTPPSLFGADAHSIYVAASGTAPTFSSASTDFNGFTANLNYNAAAQNRIVSARSASYISFGKTEATYTTELDFITKAEYDNFKAATTRAVKLESVKPSGSAFAAATEAFQLTFFRSAYDAYGIALGGIGDLIMASVTGHGLSQTGGVPYKITCKSPLTIT